MVIIHFPNGRFGNQVLYYNNMRQMATRRGCGYRSPPWDGDKIFNITNVITDNTNWDIIEHCLGKSFF